MTGRVPAPDSCKRAGVGCLQRGTFELVAVRSSAAPYLPVDVHDVDALRRASAGCHGCPLYEHANQTVFGAGDPHAAVMLVGEQPGDVEDREGEPFVGPAGRLLREAMADAGLRVEDAYLTNAVKHFKFERRGKLRLHKKPSAGEVAACAPWLEAELGAVRPQVVVALGATAGQALLGPELRVTRDRGATRPGPHGALVVPTVHPSSILRAPNHDERAAAAERFVDELRSVRGLLTSARGRTVRDARDPVSSAARSGRQSGGAKAPSKPRRPPGSDR